MRILQIGKFYYPFIGGVEKAIYDMANGLIKKDDVSVEVLVCNKERQDLVEYVNGVKVTRVKSIGTYFSMPVAPGFPSFLRKMKADIYHFNLPFPLGDISYMLVKPKGKVVITWHSDIVKQKKILWIYKNFLIRFLKNVDVILTTSPQMIESSPFLQCVREKCKVIPLGIDVKPFINIDRRVEKNIISIKQKYGERLVLFVGRFVYYKGIQYLVEAMKYVDGKLLLAGTGPLEGELKRSAAELGLEDKVFFIGRVKDDELPAYYYACDLFVLPSIERSEAFGLVQLEAMACGKPVVSTNLQTGVPFVNQHRKTGIIVEPKNAAQLAGAISELLDDDKLRNMYGVNARERVLQEFTSERMTEEIYRVYKSLMVPSQHSPYI